MIFANFFLSVPPFNLRTASQLHVEPRRLSLSIVPGFLPKPEYAMRVRAWQTDPFGLPAKERGGGGGFGTKRRVGFPSCQNVGCGFRWSMRLSDPAPPPEMVIMPVFFFCGQAWSLFLVRCLPVRGVAWGGVQQERQIPLHSSQPLHASRTGRHTWVSRFLGF